MNIELTFVELDVNYVTVTDGIGNTHYIDDHYIDEESYKEMKSGKIEVGTDMDFDLPEHVIINNGIVGL